MAAADPLPLAVPVEFSFPPGPDLSTKRVDEGVTVYLDVVFAGAESFRTVSHWHQGAFYLVVGTATEAELAACGYAKFCVGCCILDRRNERSIIEDLGDSVAKFPSLFSHDCRCLFSCSSITHCQEHP